MKQEKENSETREQDLLQLDSSRSKDWNKQTLKRQWQWDAEFTSTISDIKDEIEEIDQQHAWAKQNYEIQVSLWLYINEAIVTQKHLVEADASQNSFDILKMNIIFEQTIRAALFEKNYIILKHSAVI